VLQTDLTKIGREGVSSIDTAHIWAP
jgi:hypothetical protein